MRSTPFHLNSAVAWLFITGSACFVIGSVQVYASAVGGVPDALTYFIGSIFFTSASFLQLLQAQTPASTGVTSAAQTKPVRLTAIAWRPHDRAWWAAITQFPGTLCFNVSTFFAVWVNASASQKNRYVWRPDFYGSTLFLISSAFALLALAQLAVGERRDPRRIGWLNMIGSILFMASAIASYVLPDDQVINVRISVTGTLLGAACFLVGAALMLPAWRAAVLRADARPQEAPAP
ncbi:MAG TPA: hypothetical protein VFP34_17870 [Microlunatus sp.]|nr:hypothetical protein [Microlunatus sp.]